MALSMVLSPVAELVLEVVVPVVIIEVLALAFSFIKPDMKPESEITILFLSSIVASERMSFYGSGLRRDSGLVTTC